MYPDLSYLFNDIFKTPFGNWASVFKTYGTSLAISFGISSLILKNELKWRETEGIIKSIPYSSLTKWIENMFIIVISAMIGYKMVFIALNISSFKINSRDMILSWQGSIIGGIFFILCSIWIVYFSHEQPQNHGKNTTNFYKLNTHMTVFIVIFALIGTKLFGIFEVDFEEKTVNQIFNESGTNFLGGLFGGLLGGYIFCQIYKIPFYNLLDPIAPVMMFGYAMGRLGCHISGDGCWGIDNNLAKPDWVILPDWVWAYTYPHNVVDKGINMINTLGTHNKILEIPVFPTSLYEAVFGFTMFFIFWKIRKKVTKPYLLFTYFLFFMGIERFLIEFIRINNKYYFLGFELSQAQYISLGLIVVSILSLWRINLTNKNRQNSLINEFNSSIV